MSSTIDNNPANNPPRFLPGADEALREAGWFPGRVVPDEQLEQWYLLRNETGPFGDCPIFPAALRALREFGGLDVEPVIEKGVTHAPVAFHCDPLEGQSYVGHGLFCYGWVLETSLYPIGYFGDEDDYYTVAMDERGQIYGLSYGLEFVATSLDDAINQCLTGTGEVNAREVEYPKEKLEEAEAMYAAIAKKMLNS